MTLQETSKPTIVFLNRDVFFGVRLKQLGGDLGYGLEIAPDAAAFIEMVTRPGVALGIIDINARPDWEAIASGIDGVALPPILAFGPHLDVDGLRAAKSAGVTRVVSNGTFHRDAAALIERYASGAASGRDDDLDELTAEH